MNIAEFQKHIEKIYFDRDNTRGMEATFMWFVEEVGELSRSLRRESGKPLEVEFADCAAWLATLASIAGVDLEAAIQEQYGNGCPKCGNTPCDCREK